MKNLLTMILLLALCLCLCACGENKEAAATPTPAPVEEPTSTQQSVLPGATLEAAEEEPEEEVNEDLETAKSFLEKDVAELIAVFGEPNSSDYGPSCLGSGEDGELHYDAFTVYTYREGESEIVKDVE